MTRPTPTRRPARHKRPPRDAAASRARILAAASIEFAARGFDGAKVDRIAAHAKLNKAMLYYHFKSKAALYREILVDMFETVGAAVREAVDPAGRADDQLAAYIRAFARAAESRPHFPQIWLREIAEGGRHVDDAIVGRMRGIVQIVAGILQRGQAAGTFAPANPFITQIGIVAPIMFLAASRQVRDRFPGKLPAPIANATLNEMVAHVSAATLAALRAPSSALPESRRTP
jgi:TetR/AcrR family transcriptional regulator